MSAQRRRSPNEQTARANLATELERLAKATPFAALGVEPGADRARIREGYLKAAKRWHPNRFARHGEQVRRLATEIFVRIRDAYDQLCDELGDRSDAAAPEPARAPEPERPSVRTSSTRRARMRSRSAQAASGPELSDVETFEKGRALLRQERFADAREAFESLAARYPSEPRYQVHLHYAAAREHQQRKDSETARRALERALAIDPDFAKAKQALDELSDAKTRGRGLFSRLFRK